MELTGSYEHREATFKLKRMEANVKGDGMDRISKFDLADPIQSRGDDEYIARLRSSLVISSECFEIGYLLCPSYSRLLQLKDLTFSCNPSL